MATKKILVSATNYSLYCAEAKNLLEEHGVEVVENNNGRPFTREELLDMVGDIDGVVVGVDTWNDEIFRHAPKLKGMSRFGVGVDNINLEDARRHGIVVTNAKGMNSAPVAEFAVALMLSCLRNIPNFHNSTRLGEWDRTMGRDIAGMTVGLLGFGDIAQKVARKLSGFDVILKAYDPYPNEEMAKQLGVSMVSMEEVLSTADIVSMHMPSLPQTHHTMNDDTFGQMKDGTYFVNTARGALVDEAALYRALQSGKLTAAASDVYESEPTRADHPLFQLNNFISTPHTAAETYATYRTIGLETAQALLDVFEGRQPRNQLV